MKNISFKICIVLFVFTVVLLIPQKACAHCDTLDGPVVQDARMALKKGDVTPVLKWVKEKSEPEIRTAFDKALLKRKSNEKNADMEFFETVVRVHRAGEGADFTGLKPAGTIEPAIEKADKAIEEESVDELADKVGNVVASGIKERFARLIEAKKHMKDSVDAGRKYVAAYVEYIHYFQEIYNLATGGSIHDHE